MKSLSFYWGSSSSKNLCSKPTYNCSCCCDWKAKSQGLWCKWLYCSGGKLSTQAVSQSNCLVVDNAREYCAKQHVWELLSAPENNAEAIWEIKSEWSFQTGFMYSFMHTPEIPHGISTFPEQLKAPSLAYFCNQPPTISALFLKGKVRFIYATRAQRFLGHRIQDVHLPAPVPNKPGSEAIHTARACQCAHCISLNCHRIPSLYTRAA